MRFAAAESAAVVRAFSEECLATYLRTVVLGATAAGSAAVGLGLGSAPVGPLSSAVSNLRFEAVVAEAVALSAEAVTEAPLEPEETDVEASERSALVTVDEEATSRSVAATATMTYFGARQ